jgi:hypothetical protein
MGLGPPILGLYRQLKTLGAFENVHDVMEIGAQNVWCPRVELVRNLFRAFDKPPPSQDMLDRFANWKGSAEELYTALGFNYRCTDVDPQFNSIRLDLNFDECPPEHRLQYDFVTNHGTSEHLLNQYNFFKLFHDLTKPDGLMLHAVPFTVHLEHGFFNYQPNFFDSLARYNSYRMLGTWVGPGWQAASLIPWEPDILDYMVINSKTTHLLVVLMQKMYDKPFNVPFQGVYEAGTPDEVMQRYNVIIDGALFDGQRVKHLTTDKIVADRVEHETLVLRNELASVNGKYWDVAGRLAAAENQIEPLRAELAASLLRYQILQDAVQDISPRVKQKSQEKLERRAAQSAPELSGRELLNELKNRIMRRLFG